MITALLITTNIILLAYSVVQTKRVNELQLEKLTETNRLKTQIAELKIEKLRSTLDELQAKNK